MIIKYRGDIIDIPLIMSFCQLPAWVLIFFLAFGNYSQSSFFFIKYKMYLSQMYVWESRDGVGHILIMEPSLQQVSNKC